MRGCYGDDGGNYVFRATLIIWQSHPGAVLLTHKLPQIEGGAFIIDEAERRVCRNTDVTAIQ